MAKPALKGTAELFEGDIMKPLASNSKDQKVMMKFGTAK